MYNHSGINTEIVLSQGNDFSVGIYALYADGSPFSLINYTGISNIRSSYAATGIVGSFNVNIVTPESGYIVLSMPATGTATLPASLLLFDLELASGTYQTKYLCGKVIVYPSLSSNFK